MILARHVARRNLRDSFTASVSSSFQSTYTDTAKASFSSADTNFIKDPRTDSISSLDKLLEGGRGILNLLTNQQRDLLLEQKDLSRQATALAQKVGGVDLQYTGHSPFLEQILTKNRDTSDQAISDRADSKEALESTFSVVIAGEFNAGKSTLINALLGDKLLETGSLPTTDQITVITGFQNEEMEKNNSQDSREETLEKVVTTTGHSNAIILHRVPNMPLLNDLTLIDTPGTNAVINNHTTRTLKLLPSADLILFVTSADRPFPESEKQLLKSIQNYRKNIVIIINKMDVLEASGGDHGESEKNKVTQFVAENAADLLGARAIVLPVSAKDALAAKLIHGSEIDTNSDNKSASFTKSKVWKRSNFSDLEKFLMESLTDETKVQAKLLNPLGVTEGMLNECMDVLKRRAKDLETDTATVQLLQSQMDSWMYDMDKDMKEFQSNVQDILAKEKDRCDKFLNSMGFFERYTLVLGSDDAKLNTKWNDTKSITVSHDIQKELLSVASDCSDTIATSSRAQGQAVIEYLGKRPVLVGQNLVGSVTAASRFEDTRKDLSGKMAEAVKSVLSTYNADEEKSRVFGPLKTATYISSSANLASLVSGATTALEMVDIIPGSACSIAFAFLGFSIMPYTNGKIISDYEETWANRDEKLKSALETLAMREIQRIHKRILDGVAPYTRYVTTEEKGIETMKEECDALSNCAQILRNKIIKLR